jgi:hypothetical protein
MKAGYNRDAAEDSWARIEAFFAKHLALPRLRGRAREGARRHTQGVWPGPLPDRGRGPRFGLR